MSDDEVVRAVEPRTAAGRSSLGELVRRARGSMGLRELARKGGISPSYLSDIEHDRRRPSEDVWKRLVLVVPVYGGALIQDRLEQLERDEPLLYAAAITKGMARGRENAEAEAEAAAQAEDSLDVERLNEAIRRARDEAHRRGFVPENRPLEFANIIAAEYQRLAEKPHD